MVKKIEKNEKKSANPSAVSAASKGKKVKNGKGNGVAAAPLSAKELQDKIIGEIKRFISMGKSRGFLTYEEVNDLLPPEISSPELLDILMEALDENDVKLV